MLLSPHVSILLFLNDEGKIKRTVASSSCKVLLKAGKAVEALRPGHI